MLWVRVKDRYTDEVLHEYSSVFTDIEEATEDVYRMIEEGRIPYLYGGCLVEFWDTHPDIPGAKKVGWRKL